MIMRADEFLNLYRTLEELLGEKYGDKTRYGSVVMQFINDRDGRQFKDRLNLCREIRNLLSHHPEIDGERIVEPSQAMIDTLKDVISYIKRPPMALDFATTYENLLKVSPHQKVLPVMKKMEQRGFSHVPVIDDGRFIGVFSVGTIFMYITSSFQISESDDMEIGDFSEFLPFEAHSTERFSFMPKTATAIDLEAAFEQPSKRSRRLAAVFITDSGSKSDPLLGMITPWDILRGRAAPAGETRRHFSPCGEKPRH